jgi:diguanylate cyclase (GGDEF)-like protein
LEAIEDAQQNKHRHMLLFMDLDKFKLINDTCGHNAGDLFLCKIGGLMQQCIRQSDIIARLGGDEFGIILKSCSPEAACEIARKIGATVEGFRFDWEGKTFSCGISIGLAEIDSQCKNTSWVMNIADKACYLAKERGGHLYIYEDPASYIYRLPF